MILSTYDYFSKRRKIWVPVKTTLNKLVAFVNSFA
jgi:hypothetical protein